MRKRLVTLMAAVAMALMTGTAACAADLLTPTGLNPGDTFRFIFVTSTSRNATSSVIDDYNTFVQNDAAGYTYGGQPITWKAIGSTASVNARDNIGGFNTNVPVYLVTGTKVANDLTTNSGGLWGGSLLVSIDKSLSGGQVNQEVWTGTLDDGTKSPPLHLGKDDIAAFGNSTFTTGGWTAGGIGSVLVSKPFYGVSADLIVPVPEPSTWALGAIASGVMAHIARRRKARRA